MLASGSIGSPSDHQAQDNVSLSLSSHYQGHPDPTRADTNTFTMQHLHQPTTGDFM
jgi:hypothetical protein